MDIVFTEKGKIMTDKEKLDLIRKLALNLNPIDFTNHDQGLGAGHALAVTIDLIVNMPGDEIPEILVDPGRFNNFKRTE